MYAASSACELSGDRLDVSGRYLSGAKMTESPWSQISYCLIHLHTGHPLAAYGTVSAKDADRKQPENLLLICGGR